MLCTPPKIRVGYNPPPWHPLIHPFEPNKVKLYGVSHGLSAASYDASIAHDLVLGRHPGFVIKEWALNHFSDLEMLRQPIAMTRLGRIKRMLKTVQAVYQLLADLGDLVHRLRTEPPHFALAHTVEDFCFPANVAGAVCDKSTFARVFVSAYNTFFDPGFHGNATLELVNDSDKVVEYKAGQGVCQFIFTWLDEPTEEPYAGKYQGQTKAAHAARFEGDDKPRQPWQSKTS